MIYCGGVVVDGLIGDGCGLLLCCFDVFLKLLVSEVGIVVVVCFVVGLVFLLYDIEVVDVCCIQLQVQVEVVGCKVVGWCEVLINDSVCGQLVCDILLCIEQVFVDVGVGQDDVGFVLVLFLVCCCSEQQLCDYVDFYVIIFILDVISYKGMVLLDKFSCFFLDL